MRFYSLVQRNFDGNMQCYALTNYEISKEREIEFWRNVWNKVNIMDKGNLIDEIEKHLPHYFPKDHPHIYNYPRVVLDMGEITEEEAKTFEKFISGVYRMTDEF